MRGQGRFVLFKLVGRVSEGYPTGYFWLSGHIHEIFPKLHIFSMIWVILEVSIFQTPVFICQPGDQKYFPIFGEFDGLYIINTFHTLEGPSRSTLNQFHWVSKQIKPSFWNLKKLDLTKTPQNRSNLPGIRDRVRNSFFPKQVRWVPFVTWVK